MFRPGLSLTGFPCLLPLLAALWLGRLGAIDGGTMRAQAFAAVRPGFVLAGFHGFLPGFLPFLAEFRTGSLSAVPWHGFDSGGIAIAAGASVRRSRAGLRIGDTCQKGGKEEGGTGFERGFHDGLRESG